MVLNVLTLVLIAICIASLSLSTFGTYRFLNQSKSFLNENTYKTMHMLITALLIESISMTMIITLPIGFAFLYEKFDTSLTAAAIKNICYNFVNISLPISDIIKLICVKNYRSDELELWIRGSFPGSKIEKKFSKI